MQGGYAECLSIPADIEGYPVFVPARSTNQSEYVELMELLSVSWAKARESAGIAAPAFNAPEETIADQGDLVILHHLVSYFSEQHNARLNEAASKAEEEAIELAKSAADRKGVAARALLDKKSAEETKVREAASSNEVKQITNGATSDQPYNTARAEVALAWLQTAILPQLAATEASKSLSRPNEQEEHSRVGEPSSSMSDSLTESLRSGSSASSATLPGTVSSRATTPSSPPPFMSSKGKGKARAVDDQIDPIDEAGASNSIKGKGRAR